MRELATAVTLIALVSCASQSQPRLLDVQVFEQRPRTRAASLEGQHAFHIRITNHSEEALTVEAISLTPASNLIQFHDGDQIVGETIEPGQTADLNVWITVT